MSLGARAILAVALVAAAFLCGFGFLATFEPPGSWVLAVGYAVAGLACAAGAVRLLRTGRAKKRRRA